MCKVMFSIIVPVYNVENYIKECLDSIKNQSFIDFEVLCIDDGSTDNSLKILQEYANNDARFKVSSQKNQGQGVARNKAIDVATGKYLLCVDPDDIIDLDTLEILNNRLREQDVDLILFDYQIFGDIVKTENVYLSDEIEKTLKLSISDNQIFNWQSFAKGNISKIPQMPCTKVCSRKFIKENSLKFSPNKLGEDHIFSIGATLLANKILYVQKPLYHYRKRVGSAVNRVSKENICIFENIKRIKDFLIKENIFEKIRNDYENYCLDVLIINYPNIPKNFQKEYIERSRKILSNRGFNIFRKKIDGDFSFLEKIFSVKNIRVVGEKVKYLSILGFKIQLPDNKNGGVKCHN